MKNSVIALVCGLLSAIPVAASAASALMAAPAAGVPMAAPAAGAPMTAGAASAPRDVTVIAHRACWEDGWPEVSISAIRACEAIGPDIIEIDVRQTRDGALVLMHDSTVDRTTNGKGAVADMTLAEIRALRLRAGIGGPDAPILDEQVPTLEEGLQAAKGKFIVHLHRYTDASADAAIAATVRKLDMAGQVTTWVSGRPDDSHLVHSPLRGAVGLMPIIAECRTPSAEGCWTAPVRSLAGYAPYQPVGFYVIPNGPFNTGAARQYLQDAAAAPRPQDARILVSTLFHLDKLPLPALQAEWRALIAHGANVIMTDRPAALIELLRTEERR